MAPAIHISRPIRIVFGLVLATTVAVGLVDNVGAVTQWAGRADITDFHAFYLVGQLVWAGRFEQAYHAAAMLALETAFGGGRVVFMPWSYPPLFGIVVAGLAALPLGVAYVLFVTTTSALYVWAISRLETPDRWAIVLASTVSIVLNLRCGQNGLLTAGIVAAAAGLLLSAKPTRAGFCLAAMVFKPHLIPLIPVVLAIERRWLVLSVAALGGVALTGLSVAIFGPTIFAAFLHALPDVGRLMAVGAYPLHRMTSIFVFCIGIGLPPSVATLVHGAVALAVLAGTATVAVRYPEPRVRLGLAILAGFFLSPYVYDYDFVLFGVGMMLVSPALRSSVSQRTYAFIVCGCALSQSLGLLMNPLLQWNPDLHVSLAGPVVLAVVGCVLKGLWVGSSRPALGNRPCSASTAA